MTKEETLDLLELMKVHYNNYFKNLDTRQEELYFLSLYAMFKDFGKDKVFESFINSLSCESFGQPNLAVIKQNLIPKINIDCEKMWAIAMKNCRADMRYARENYEKLDPNIKPYFTPELLNEIGWATNDEISYIKQRVFKDWQGMAKNINEKALLGVTDVRLLQ